MLDPAVAEGLKQLPHPCDDVGVAPVAAAKQDQARLIGAGERKQARVVQVCSDNGALFRFGPSNDLHVRCPVHPDIESMDRIVSTIDQPARQGGRQRHVNEKLHPASSTVSSSARSAA